MCESRCVNRPDFIGLLLIALGLLALIGLELFLRIG